MNTIRSIFSYLFGGSLDEDAYFTKYPDKHIFIRQNGEVSVNTDHILYSIKTGLSCCTPPIMTDIKSKRTRASQAYFTRNHR
jgi:hypothetical protein